MEPEKFYIKKQLIRAGILLIKDLDEEPFILKSGKRSRIFVNIKLALLNPELLKSLVYLTIKNHSWIKKNELFGSIAVGAVPFGTALSTSFNRNQIIIRTEKHLRGEQKQIIGNCKGKTVVLIDDVATSGISIVEAAHAIWEAGGYCNSALVVVDREEGAKRKLQDHYLYIHSLFTRKELLGDRDEY